MSTELDAEKGAASRFSYKQVQAGLKNEKPLGGRIERGVESPTVDTWAKIIGRLDGDWLRDRTGKLVARYDKSDDTTRDSSGRIVGKGDQRLRKLGDR